ncbi:hypothetical protein ACFY4B_27315 [Kitasatospora sp. NPDC001261]|uniref:hypothetical protein n=1 Tax=Kitasatospora sp. NPDC001261 TaxID=3364012 RepID=UPI0036C12BC6
MQAPCDDCRTRSDLRLHTRLTLAGNMIRTYLCPPCGTDFDAATARIEAEHPRVLELV